LKKPDEQKVNKSFLTSSVWTGKGGGKPKDDQHNHGEEGKKGISFKTKKEKKKAPSTPWKRIRGEGSALTSPLRTSGRKKKSRIQEKKRVLRVGPSSISRKQKKVS